MSQKLLSFISVCIPCFILLTFAGELFGRQSFVVYPRMSDKMKKKQLLIEISIAYFIPVDIRRFQGGEATLEGLYR